MKYLSLSIMIVLFLSLTVVPDSIGKSQTDTDIELAENLIEAVQNIDYISINVLLAEGATVDTVDAQGNTPLMIASKIGNPRLVNILLLQEPSINATNNRGETALMIAARGGVMQVVDQLIENGANSTLKNNDGLTSAQIALRHGHAAIASKLSEESILPFSR
ncbi:MAG: ankyrin repeat domain-containing protein [Balneolaceae bacterium]